MPSNKTDGSSLVIVESPTKAKTIRKFLGDGYEILASMGHVRDLPSHADEIPAELKKEKWARLGVDVSKGYKPLYVIPDRKKKVVQELKKALKGASRLYIATDEDREGESIGWHLVEVLQPKIPVERMVFHEITAEAIEKALGKTRAIDAHLVDAQETRRILDRLVGYTLSPLLWRKVAPKLSAGRVQSVAVRLLVMRERERMAFTAAKYFDLAAKLEKGKNVFEAQLAFVDGKKIATGSDFDAQTGQSKTPSVLLLDEKASKGLQEQLHHATWTVKDVQEKQEERHPSAPFTTSTLQQEANRKLRLSARETMRTAQGLYERGLITYMRTDSTQLSGEAIAAARAKVASQYGAAYLPASPRQYATKSKGAQEAHEAIRPSGTQMRTREELGLSGAEGALYDMIWKRTVACQMQAASLAFTTADIEAKADSTTALFTATGKRILFPGFLMAYTQGSDDPNAALDDQEHPLPALARSDVLDLKHLEAREHVTAPPARYTEASLVKKLEAEGIGRPSTYAAIMETILERGYASKSGMQLVPTFTAFAVTQLLEGNFPNLVDLKFTASMEQILDDIAEGKSKEKKYLHELYEGKDGLEKKVEEGLERIDPKAVSTVTSPKWDPYIVRVGRFGPYMENGTAEKNISLDPALAPGDLTRETLSSMAKFGAAADQSIGVDPTTNLPVFLKQGPYGFYVQLGEGNGNQEKVKGKEERKGKAKTKAKEKAGIAEFKPKRVSIPRGVDPARVDFAKALELLSLPKVIGKHQATGKDLVINIGRFGPYVQHERTFASVKFLDDLLALTVKQATELVDAKVKKSGPVHVVGVDPEIKEEITVHKGRFGFYVKRGKTFASLPKGTEPETVTLEEAKELLVKKAGGKRKGGKTPNSKIKSQKKPKTSTSKH